MEQELQKFVAGLQKSAAEKKLALEKLRELSELKKRHREEEMEMLQDVISILGGKAKKEAAPKKETATEEDIRAALAEVDPKFAGYPEEERKSQVRLRVTANNKRWSEKTYQGVIAQMPKWERGAKPDLNKSLEEREARAATG